MIEDMSFSHRDNNKSMNIGCLARNSPFCVVAVFSVPMHFIFTHYISNERESGSLSNDTTNYMIKVISEKW